jgi:hypothetical protein
VVLQAIQQVVLPADQKVVFQALHPTAGMQAKWHRVQREALHCRAKAATQELGGRHRLAWTA